MMQESRSTPAHRPSVMGRALLALHASGVCRLAPRSLAGEGVIFMLHRVRPDDGRAFAPNRILEITPDFLDETIRLVKARGYRCLSLDDAVTRISSGARPERFVVFTLDDGYKDNLSDALPVFERHGVPFTLYLTTGLPDGDAEIWWVALERIIEAATDIEAHLPGGPKRFSTRTAEEKNAAWEGIYWPLRELPEVELRAEVRRLAGIHNVDIKAITRELALSWDDVRALAAHPLASVEAHTAAHFAQARLSAHDARIDIENGVARMEAELGYRPRHFSYPYGDPSSAGTRDFALAEALGFRSATTTRKGMIHRSHSKRLWSLPRLSLNGDFQDRRMLEALLSGLPFALARPIKSLGID
ncbi:MAG: polysaccharide deacetylase family protein [Alphaproteobacteria bacterium]|nr:polysaccharide deacetylase family protein [Alphaproteobacteria bacterium]MDX5493426.1 polysaccharide deacetylase family protein [Alphaproteobacteria bacterium]